MKLDGCKASHFLERVGSGRVSAVPDSVHLSRSKVDSQLERSRKLSRA